MNQRKQTPSTVMEVPDRSEDLPSTPTCMEKLWTQNRPTKGPRGMTNHYHALEYIRHARVLWAEMNLPFQFDLGMTHYITSRASVTLRLPLGRPLRLTSLLDNSSSAFSIVISLGFRFCPSTLYYHELWLLFDEFLQDEKLVNSDILFDNFLFEKIKTNKVKWINQ